MDTYNLIRAFDVTVGTVSVMPLSYFRLESDPSMSLGDITSVNITKLQVPSLATIVGVLCSY